MELSGCMALSDILGRHRGPYRFCVQRPSPKANILHSVWLPGEVKSDDVGSEALALLMDPRDSIRSVSVYSEREGQFVTTVSGEKDL